MNTYLMEDKYRFIKERVCSSKSKNPIEIVKAIMKEDFINMHGPEHHFLDGSSFLVAFKNAGGSIDLENAINEMANRAIKMPGAMCGYWGVCGASASIGAALSIINKTSPISNDEFYKHNMEFTSRVINRMSQIGGPRCCKRNAFLSISEGVKFVKEKYNIEMELNDIQCEFSNMNTQCISTRCPFYKK